MRSTYLFIGIFVIGLVFVAAYIFQSGKVKNDFGILTSTPPPMANTFSLTSSAFENNGMIPAKYTCDGERELSPPLSIGGMPEGTKSFVLLMDDPDIPDAVKKARGIEVFDHWTLFNIPPETREIPEDTTIGTKGLNGAGAGGYIGPCPPPQYEPREHRYMFVLYALDGVLHFDEMPTKQQVLNALSPMLLAKTQLTGRYSRQ